MLIVKVLFQSEIVPFNTDDISSISDYKNPAVLNDWTEEARHIIPACGQLWRSIYN